MTRRRPTVVGSVVLAVALAVLVSPTASAHDQLVSSSPADESTVTQAPAEIVLTFDEPAIAMGTRLVVTGPGGEVQQGAPRLVDKTVTQGLAAGAPAGAYTVDWRVTSADGHPVSGTLHFTATAAAAGPPASSASASSGVPASSGDSAPAPAPASRTGIWLWLVVGVAVLSMAAVAVRARRRRDLRGDSADRSTSGTTSKENL